MKLCAVFESWYLEEGSYEPLFKGQKVNLAFEMRNCKLSFSTDQQRFFNQDKYNHYSFKALITALTMDDGIEKTITLNAGEQNFYTTNISDIAEVDTETLYVQGDGDLYVDYFYWANEFNSYNNLPDIYSNFIIDRIRVLDIREDMSDDKKFISHRTSLNSDEYNDEGLTEINHMIHPVYQPSFYLLDLTSIDEKVDKTCKY